MAGQVGEEAPDVVAPGGPAAALGARGAQRVEAAEEVACSARRRAHSGSLFRGAFLDLLEEVPALLLLEMGPERPAQRVEAGGDDVGADPRAGRGALEGVLDLREQLAEPPVLTGGGARGPGRRRRVRSWRPRGREPPPRRLRVGLAELRLARRTRIASRPKVRSGRLAPSTTFAAGPDDFGRFGQAGDQDSELRRLEVGHGEGRHVPALGRLRDPARPLLLDLVHADDRVHRQVAALDAVELALQALLGGVDHDPRLLPEDEPLDLDEAEQAALAHALRVDLVDLALVEERDLVQPLACHRSLDDSAKPPRLVPVEGAGMVASARGRE